MGHALTGPPFLVRAIEPNVRAAAQEGYFVAGRVPDDPSDVFRSFHVPFSPIEPGILSFVNERGRGAPRKLPFVAVMIKKPLKQKILRYIDSSYNRSARTLFPDYPGFREFGAGIHDGDASSFFDAVSPNSAVDLE